MTETAPAQIQLPEPGYPMVLAAFTEHVEKRDEITCWRYDQPHPFIPKAHVMRMFIVARGGIEIYSLSTDGKDCIRDFIPMNRIKYIQEGMPIDVFADEMDAAEEALAAGGDVDDDDDDDEPEQPERPQALAPAPQNGQLPP